MAKARSLIFSHWSKKQIISKKKKEKKSKMLKQFSLKIVLPKVISIIYFNSTFKQIHGTRFVVKSQTGFCYLTGVKPQ